MRIVMVALAAVSFVAIVSPASSLAQGRRANLNQAAKASGANGNIGGMRGPSSPRGPATTGDAKSLEKGKLGRSGQGLSRAPELRGGLGPARSPSSSGLNHSLKGRATAARRGDNSLRSADARGTSPGSSPSMDNAERIRDHRMNQAEHLRRVGAANGNERLNSTADRMEANAQRNYERRIGVEAPSDVPPANDAAGEAPAAAAPSEPTPGSAEAPSNPPTDAPAAPPALVAPRNSWIPGWLRKR